MTEGELWPGETRNYIRNGCILLDESEIRIPGTDILAHMTSGKNGHIFRGSNRFLNCTVAVKVWTRIKPEDSRDKFLQGVAEARKTAEANIHHVIRIYHADEAAG